MLLRKNFSRWVKLFFVISLSFLFAAIYRNAVSVIYPAVNTRAYFRQISKFSLAFMKFYLYNLFRFNALVAELVDAADLKSVGRKAVPVRFRPSAPSFLLEYQALNSRAKAIKLRLFIFENYWKTNAYSFASVKITLGEQNVWKVYGKLYGK